MELTNFNKDRNKKRKPSIDMTTMVYGKVPPQSKQAEEAILGACLVDNKAFEKAVEILQPECFYVDAHQRIFKAFISLRQQSLPIDLTTAIEQLLKTEELDLVGGPYALSKLTNNVVSGAHIEAHSKIVYEKYMRREVIRLGGEMIGEGYEASGDVFDLVDVIEHKLSSLATSRNTKLYTPIQELISDAVMKIDEVRISKKELTGVPSGLGKLDLITQGWQPGNLIVLAARPSVGKSAVAANFGLNACLHAEKPTGVGIFTLEMPGLQWAMRMLSSESRIPMWDLKRGRLSEADMSTIYNRAVCKFVNVTMVVDDTSGIDLYQLKSKARMMVLKEKVGLIIIDYMQLMSGSRSFGENREQEISKISRELKQLAKELNIPIIALSQLSRAGDNKDPSLSHLRESGAIEQDADDVIFLIPVDEEMVAQDASLKDSILVKIAKHRNGVLEKIPIKFVKEIQKLMSESEYDNYKSNSEMPGKLWKPLPPGTVPRNEQFDEGIIVDQPF